MSIVKITFNDDKESTPFSDVRSLDYKDDYIILTFKDKTQKVFTSKTFETLELDIDVPDYSDNDNDDLPF